jgi:hypothetical protein
MVINFSVDGQLDFSNINYVIVFNTCGVGGEPYPQGFQTTYTNYSYSFAVGPTFANSVALPYLFEYYISGGALRPFQVSSLNGSQVQFNPDLTGDQTTFQLTFTRALMNNILNISPAPCIVAGASTPESPIWYINFFTLDNNLNVLDSLGQGGPTDTTFSLSVNTNNLVQHAITRAAGSQHASNPNAWITGGQINSYP